MNPEGLLLYSGGFANGKRSGVGTEYDENGQVRYTGTVSYTHLRLRWPPTLTKGPALALGYRNNEKKKFLYPGAL